VSETRFRIFGVFPPTIEGGSLCLGEGGSRPYDGRHRGGSGRGKWWGSHDEEFRGGSSGGCAWCDEAAPKVGEELVRWARVEV
jgi:hypothetical protein